MHLSRSSLPRRALSSQRGLSIVELMVGVTVGLFVLAGATVVATGQIIDNRRLLLETQVQQDMRATMDIITRDIRRSGYYEKAYEAVAPGATVDAASLVSAYSPATVPSSSEVQYNWSHDRDQAEQENNAVDSDEMNGFRWNATDGTIEVRLGANQYQALTDPGVLRITNFNVTLAEQTINLPCSGGGCTGVTGCGPRTQKVRAVTVMMDGEAVHDASVKRSLVSTVRVRNDQVCI